MKPLSLTACLLSACLAAAAPARAADRLKDEASAFLRTNAASPVDWMPWGDAAVERAHREQRPVFLFVGSFTSELARAMTRQTFANPEAAAWLNKNFICVIADRDEHPEVASLYGSYVSDVKQLGGWPLNVFLTPDFAPFEGAAYLGPSEDWGRPGFLKLANQAKTAWEASPAACRKRAQEAVTQLAPPSKATEVRAWSSEKTQARLDAAQAAWLASFDAVHGGFSDPPKAPNPELLRFLLLRPGAGRDAALVTLRAMAGSALRDPLDGGFYHYASDDAWRLPYPQKLLADQARVALAYTLAAEGPDAQSFERTARGALDYALGSLALPDGTFCAAVDATGDEYVATYAWRAADIDAALGPDAAAFRLAHGVEASGNVPASDDPSGTYAGRNLLRSPAGPDTPASAIARLLALRNQRPAPPRDPRATAEAHGLLLSALSRAAERFHDARYRDAAGQVLASARRAFLASEDGELRHLAGSGLPGAPGDYAALALGCIDAGRARGDPAASALGARLLARLNARFYDPVSGRYFATAAEHTPGLFVRPYGDPEPPAAESLAIEAGTPNAAEVAAALSDSLEETAAQAPADALLALQVYRRP